MPIPKHRLNHFRQESSRARDGIAVIFDLAGFSQFFNQPDVHSYIPKYLNHIIRCVEITIYGGKQFWIKEAKDQTISPLSILPVHRKFLGDGMLYVFTSNGTSKFDYYFIINLLNRLWNIQNSFKEITTACADFIPFLELPKAIRFGIARGTIYELAIDNSTEKEYIGVCINLASRLQRYCPGLDFIASARVDISKDKIERNKYTKVVAKKIKGFPQELVILDANEFKALDESAKLELFDFTVSQKETAPQPPNTPESPDILDDTPF